MIKSIFFLLFSATLAYGQSFAPAPDSTGTTAIHYSSPDFVAWATGGTIVRGFVNINDTTVMYDDDNRASFGTLENAFGPSTGDGAHIVSLGDSGVVILTFDYIIQDGPGFDFAVFENGFTDGYMEFAHVEVSTDGIHFVRFSSTSEIPVDPQSNNGTIGDCRMVNNLAGKYRVGYGTPFDLSELIGALNLDVMNINYVRLIDVVGDVDGDHTTLDGTGMPVNDPFPTPFHSGGFDLDAVGILNGTLGIKDQHNDLLSIAPNPTSGLLTVNAPKRGTLRLIDVNGKQVLEIEHNNITSLDLSNWNAGIYVLQLTSEDGVWVKRVIVE